MYNADKYLILFVIGGVGYGAIEIAFRGHTHWSMILTGGSAFLSLYLIHQAFGNASIFFKAFIGMIAITVLELIVGIIVNKLFGLAVWDYSKMPVNFMGQISLTFSACWYALSFISFILFDNIKLLNNLQKP